MKDKERTAAFFHALIPGLLIVWPLAFGCLVAGALWHHTANWSVGFVGMKAVESFAFGFFYAVAVSEKKKRSNQHNHMAGPTSTGQGDSSYR